MKESLVQGLGMGLGFGVTLLVSRMVSDFLQGLFFDKKGSDE